MAIECVMGMVALRGVMAVNSFFAEGLLFKEGLRDGVGPQAGIDRWRDGQTIEFLRLVGISRGEAAMQRYEYNSIMNSTRVGCPGTRIKTGFAGFLLQQQ